MAHRLLAGRALEIHVHRLGEGEDEVAVLADEEVVLFLVPFAPREFVEHRLHVLPDRVIDLIGPEAARGR